MNSVMAGNHSLRLLNSKPPPFVPAAPSLLLLFSLLLLLPCNLAQPIKVPFTSTFKDIYTPIWGADGKHIVVAPDGKSVRVLIDATSGAGFNSSSAYKYAFFSAMIKLPGNQYTAGIVVTFYTSNQDRFPKNHDEIDWEFLGNVPGYKWTSQTNVYGNGNVHEGKEERYDLWFDPTKDFHRYSILWTAKNIIFYVDDIPIREVWQRKQLQGDYPFKPMSSYITVWEASNWATQGGKYKVDYKYAPFVTEYKDFLIQGCKVDAKTQVPARDCQKQDDDLNKADYALLTPKRRNSLRWFRAKYVTYSYCYDRKRFPTPPAECMSAREESPLYTETGNRKDPTPGFKLPGQA